MLDNTQTQWGCHLKSCIGKDSEALGLFARTVTDEGWGVTVLLWLDFSLGDLLIVYH